MNTHAKHLRGLPPLTGVLKRAGLQKLATGEEVETTPNSYHVCPYPRRLRPPEKPIDIVANIGGRVFVINSSNTEGYSGSGIKRLLLDRIEDSTERDAFLVFMGVSPGLVASNYPRTTRLLRENRCELHTVRTFGQRVRQLIEAQGHNQ